MSICRGCGDDKDLIKAHIIPESFFNQMRKSHGEPKLVSDIKGFYPKRASIGVYDRNILCRECEDRFRIYDDYAARILIQGESSQSKVYHHGKLIGCIHKDVEYVKIKLFLVSVLWRASISTHDFYSNVQIGPHEENARDLIWSGHPGSINDFSFIIAKFSDNTVGRAMLDPHKERWDGVSYYRFYMYGYIVHIKVDRRNTPKRFKSFEFISDGDLMFVYRDIRDSRELPLMANIIRNQRN